MFTRLEAMLGRLEGEAKRSGCCKIESQAWDSVTVIGIIWRIESHVAIVKLTIYVIYAAKSYHRLNSLGGRTRQEKKKWIRWPDQSNISNRADFE